MASEKSMKIILGVLLAPLFVALLIVILFPILMIICPITTDCVGGCDWTSCYVTLAAPVLIVALFLLTRRGRLP